MKLKKLLNGSLGNDRVLPVINAQIVSVKFRPWIIIRKRVNVENEIRKIITDGLCSCQYDQKGRLVNECMFCFYSVKMEINYTSKSLNDLFQKKLAEKDKEIEHLKQIEDSNRNEIVSIDTQLEAEKAKNKELLISFLDSLRNYVRESNTNIAHNERKSSEFVDIYLTQ